MSGGRRTDKRGQARHGRRGEVFGIRLTADERAELEKLRKAVPGPRALGPWLLWRARAGTAVVPAPAAAVVPATAAAVVPARAGSTSEPRIVVDLCAGTGAWSEPYRKAGYDVRRVTLPEQDVRDFEPPAGVWGVLAAPPCTEFSLAKNGHPRDFAKGLECVVACLRIIARASPRWWALENPTGYLSRWLGTPRDVFEPCDFGQPWTKRTAIWGTFRLPERGPFVEPEGSIFDRTRDPEELARTPAGFARAFFEANP